MTLKPWQLLAMVAIVVVGIALVVYFATRSGGGASAGTPGAPGESTTASDIVTGIGTGVTGIGAAIASAVEGSGSRQ